jgi:cytoskeletal protein RodZ
LPAPVFVRGYIVQIARFLNLDDKYVADSYMKIYKKSIEN